MRHREKREPFRFLDLPKEIRLIVYEHLPRKIKHHEARHPDEPSHRVTFIVRSVPVAILATCKLVHDEARPIVMATAKQFILNSPPRVIDGVSGRREGRMLGAIIRASVKQHDVLRDLEVGQGHCLSIRQLFEGRLRNALESKRNSRYLAKFIHQAGHQLRYGQTRTDFYFGELVNDIRTVEIAKYTSEISGIGRHWTLGADLHALNVRFHQRGIAVLCAGVLPAGLSEPASPGREIFVPQRVDFSAYGLGCYVPSLRQMTEEEWVDGWLE